MVYKTKGKRQKKKREKKKISIIADEAILLIMSDAERKTAIHQMELYINRHAYKKKYKDLVNKIFVYNYKIPRMIITQCKDDFSNKNYQGNDSEESLYINNKYNKCGV